MSYHNRTTIDINGKRLDLESYALLKAKVKELNCRNISTMFSRLYNKNKMNTREIGEEFNVSKQTARNWLLNFSSVKLRSRGGTQNKIDINSVARKHGFKTGHIMLKSLFIESGISISDAVEKLGVGTSTISRWLNRRGFIYDFGNRKWFYRGSYNKSNEKENEPSSNRRNARVFSGHAR